MKLEELESVLKSQNNLNGVFSKDDIDYFISSDDDYFVERVKVNGLLVPFKRICIGLQKLSDKNEDTELLFISGGKGQVQIKISDIETLDFNPEWTLY